MTVKIIEEKIDKGLSKPFHDMEGGTRYIAYRIKEEILQNILEEFKNESR